MKPIRFSIAILFLSVFAVSPALYSQEKQADFQVDNFEPAGIQAAGDGTFFLVCQKRSAAGMLVKNLAPELAVFKFDAGLQQVWEEPLFVKGAFGGTVTTFSYRDPAGSNSADYFFGSEQFIQVSQDGTVKEKDTGLSAKEARTTAAAFIDANGLNILTITGDEVFPTGSMNWYTFAHSDLSVKKKAITLPQPPNTDEDNDSGWRLNEVTGEGLFFYYVSYKNKPKDLTRPILSGHVVQVGPDGKAGKVLTLDPGLDAYKALPANFQQDVYPGIEVNAPLIWTSESYTSPGTKYMTTTRFYPTDNSFMGVKVDGKAGRIYTVTAINEQVEVDKKHARVQGDSRGWAFPVRSLQLDVYDLEGNRITSTKLDNTPAKLAASDNYGYEANKIELFPLVGDEGVVCKLLNNGTGMLWSVGQNGEVKKELKFKPFSYKILMDKVYLDVFSARYTSEKDFVTAPYWGEETSGVARFFDELEDEEQKGAGYLSLENCEILAVWGEKGKGVRFYSFTKN